MLVAFFHTRLIAGTVVAGHLDMVIESIERKLTKYILPFALNKIPRLCMGLEQTDVLLTLT